MEKAIKNKREAIAHHLMLDYYEVEDYRYHYGHTTQPVYAIDDYYCAVKANQKPAKHRYDMDFNWVEIADEFLNKNGYKIYKSK